MKDDRFQIRLDTQTRENLERFAQNYGLSQAAAVRLLINSASSEKQNFGAIQQQPQPKRN